MIKTVGIIGAGQMGGGVAQICALANYDVLIFDHSLEALTVALDAIIQNMVKLIKTNKLTEVELTKALARIKTSSTLDAIFDVDLVFEAAEEDQNIKRDIFIELCKGLKPSAFIATLTSTISITRLAATTNRPDKFIGTHFMNPVPQMKLVEVVRGIATSDDTYAHMTEFLATLDKTCTVTEDFPAFIVNRLLLPMINEAIYTLYEGVGSVEAIDTAMKLGANHKMGPLQLADFIGLDTCLSIMHVLHEGLSDSKYRPCPLLVKYVEAGWLGCKTGRGFYDYTGDQPVPTR